MNYNYETFKTLVFKALPKCLPEELKDTELTTSTQYKINQKIDLICIKSDKYDKIVPLFDFEKLYVATNGSVSEALSKLAKCMNDDANDYLSMLNEPSIDVESIKSAMKDPANILIICINKDINGPLLDTIPHRDFLDLSICYRLIISRDTEGMYSAVITTNIMSDVGLTEQDLYNMAMSSNKDMVSVKDLTIETMFGPNSPMSEISDYDIENNPDKLGDAMLIFSNKMMINGAGAMVYGNDKLCKIANAINNDIIIIPSSVDELLLIRPTAENVSKMPVENIIRLSSMVEEANTKVLNDVDILSDHLYYFDRSDSTVKTISKTV